MKQKIIDIHPHIISSDSIRYPYKPLSGVRSGWSTKRPFSFERLVKQMDDAGVSSAAIVQSSTTYGYDNSYVIDSIGSQPKRFVGVCSVDISKSTSIDTIESLRTMGMAGLRLFGAGSTVQTDGRWMIAPETYPVWEHMAYIDMPVCIQTTTIGLTVVEEILELFPEVNIILDHAARPDLSDGAPYLQAASLWRLSRFDNLYLKITTRTLGWSEKSPATPRTFFTRLVTEFGANRLAWGSNYPADTGPLRALVDMGHRCFATLNDQDRAAIWYGTALKLYPHLIDANKTEVLSA